ncbi:MAG: hypothetical protein IKM64_08860, partial [Clostridia bacterium]|nr:hypothetical protein [Clostridia bacterium]
PHETLENGKRAHGRYENEEKAGGESKLSLTAYFFRFPRMHSIRLAVFYTAQPVGGCATPNSQSFNHSLRKCVCVFLCSIGTMFARYILQYPVLGAGMTSLLGVEGAKPLHGLPTYHRETV